MKWILVLFFSISVAQLWWNKWHEFDLLILVAIMWLRTSCVMWLGVKALLRLVKKKVGSWSFKLNWGRISCRYFSHQRSVCFLIGTMWSIFFLFSWMKIVLCSVSISFYRRLIIFICRIFVLYSTSMMVLFRVIIEVLYSMGMRWME